MINWIELDETKTHTHIDKSAERLGKVKERNIERCTLKACHFVPLTMLKALSEECRRSWYRLYTRIERILK